MKIVIFGGGGFIGSAITDRLLLDGHELRVFERPRVNPYRDFSSNEKVEWITGDFQSVHDIKQAIEGMDIVLHLISTTLPKSSNDDPVFDVQSNLVSTLQILKSMVEYKVPRIVFISSGGTVYGNPAYLPIDEKHPTDPLVSYGIVKLAIEKYLLMFQHLHCIKVNILRVSNPYGERQRVENAQGAVTVFLDKAIRNQKIEIWGDGSVTRDYLYISDVAEAFARAVVYEGNESVFNISCGTGTSINELVQTIERCLDRSVVSEYKPGRPFDIPTSILDNSLALKELGWKPEVDLEDGMKKTAAWIQQFCQ